MRGLLRTIQVLLVLGALGIGGYAGYLAYDRLPDSSVCVSTISEQGRRTQETCNYNLAELITILIFAILALTLMVGAGVVRPSEPRSEPEAIDDLDYSVPEQAPMPPQYQLPSRTRRSPYQPMEERWPNDPV